MPDANRSEWVNVVRTLLAAVVNVLVLWPEPNQVLGDRRDGNDVAGKTSRCAARLCPRWRGLPTGAGGEMEDQVMIILALGLLLLALAVVLIIVAAAGTEDSVAFEVFGLDFEIWAWGVFVAGVVTSLIAFGGVIALRVGARQIGTSRREIEFLRKRVTELEQAESKDGASSVTR